MCSTYIHCMHEQSFADGVFLSTHALGPYFLYSLHNRLPVCPFFLFVRKMACSASQLTTRDSITSWRRIIILFLSPYLTDLIYYHGRWSSCPHMSHWQCIPLRVILLTLHCCQVGDWQWIWHVQGWLGISTAYYLTFSQIMMLMQSPVSRLTHSVSVMNRQQCALCCFPVCVPLFVVQCWEVINFSLQVNCQLSPPSRCHGQYGPERLLWGVCIYPLSLHSLVPVHLCIRLFSPQCVAQTSQMQNTLTGPTHPQWWGPVKAWYPHPQVPDQPQFSHKLGWHGENLAPHLLQRTPCCTRGVPCAAHQSPP